MPDRPPADPPPADPPPADRPPADRPPHPHRQRARWRGAATDDLPVWSAESAALAGEDRREVLQAVSQPPRRQREVVVLRYFLGLTDAEIAVDLGVSRGTVVSTASRDLAALARKIGDQV